MSDLGGMEVGVSNHKSKPPGPNHLPCAPRLAGSYRVVIVGRAWIQGTADVVPVEGIIEGIVLELCGQEILGIAE